MSACVWKRTGFYLNGRYVIGEVVVDAFRWQRDNQLEARNKQVVSILFLSSENLVSESSNEFTDSSDLVVLSRIDVHGFGVR